MSPRPARNRDGFKAEGLRVGEVRRARDGRVWRVLGPSSVHGDDTLVDVELVADPGFPVRRYARTVSLWPLTEDVGARRVA